MKFTDYAIAYTERAKRKGLQPPTWANVARAYDAGLLHALSLSPDQRRHTQRLMRVLLAANREVSKHAI